VIRHGAYRRVQGGHTKAPAPLPAPAPAAAATVTAVSADDTTEAAE